VHDETIEERCASVSAGAKDLTEVTHVFGSPLDGVGTKKGQIQARNTHLGKVPTALHLIHVALHKIDMILVLSNACPTMGIPTA
jgi:hypothetical protein